MGKGVEGRAIWYSKDKRDIINQYEIWLFEIGGCDMAVFWFWKD